MILDATTKSLEIKLAGAITSNQLPFCAEWVDVTVDDFTPGHTDGATNSGTVVTLVAAPDADTERIVKHINVYNKDTVSATVTVQYNNNTTVRELIVIALASGQTLTWSAEGGWQVVVVQAASDTVQGIIEIAVQSEMETGTDVVRAVVPGRLQYHPAACKCWGKATGDGVTLTISYNITSISDTGTGRLGVTIATDFSTANYAIQCTLERSVTSLTATGVEDNNIRNASPAAGSFEIESYDHTATTMAAQDPANYFWACFGDQA
jgi:hypothetical protein